MNTDPINALPGDWQIDFAAPYPVAADVPTDVIQALRVALAEPLSSSTLAELCVGNPQVGIVCDTSLAPDTLIALLNGTLAELHQAGVRDERVQLLIPMDSPDPIRQALAVLNLTVIQHDPDDLRELDELGMVEGVALQSNFYALNANVLISIGAVRVSLFAGYSGGSEDIAYGIGGRAFQRSLREMRYLAEREIHADPVRNRSYQRTVREAARRAGLRFVVNVLLDQQQQVVAIRTGEPNAVHDTLAELARTQREVVVSRDDYDVIVADKPTGYKSLYEASLVAVNLGGALMSPLMQGGVIMLPTQCTPEQPQSDASQRFYDALTAGRDTEMVMDMLKQRTLLPGEDQAYLLAQSMQHYKVMVIAPNETCERLARACHFIPARDMGEAADLTESLVGGRPNVLVLSDAHYTLPVFNPILRHRSEQAQDDALNLTWLDSLDDIDVEKLLDTSDAA